MSFWFIYHSFCDKRLPLSNHLFFRSSTLSISKKPIWVVTWLDLCASISSICPCVYSSKESLFKLALRTSILGKNFPCFDFLSKLNSESRSPAEEKKPLVFVFDWGLKSVPVILSFKYLVFVPFSCASLSISFNFSIIALTSGSSWSKVG